MSSTFRDNPDEDSGVFQFDRVEIRYSSKTYGSFSIALRDVAAIGEFTTQEGPCIDDRFLVFVRRADGEWFEASWFADGLDECLRELSSALGHRVHGDLALSTDFASRVLWPAPLEAKPLFQFEPVVGSGIFHRLKLAFSPRTSHRLSADVGSLLAGNA
jgi:hypothetical protein